MIRKYRAEADFGNRMQILHTVPAVHDVRWIENQYGEINGYRSYGPEESDEGERVEVSFKHGLFRLIYRLVTWE